MLTNLAAESALDHPLLVERKNPKRAGVLVVSGRVADDVFPSVVDAGADMHLAKPVTFEQVVVAIRAVHRRVASYSGTLEAGMWRATSDRAYWPMTSKPVSPAPSVLCARPSDSPAARSSASEIGGSEGGSEEPALGADGGGLGAAGPREIACASGPRNNRGRASGGIAQLG